jgi:hypothetical protein
VVERVSDVVEMIDSEQKWMDSLGACDAQTGFNAAKFAGDVPMRGRTHSVETRAKISAIQQGKEHPLESRKLRRSEIANIIESVVAGGHPKCLAKEYNVSRCAIEDVIYRRRWASVNLPEELENRRVSYLSDMKKRPNQVRGSSQWKSRLTESQVIQIISLLESGEPCSEIAKVFQVKRVTVSAIKHGRTWGHLTGRG